MVRGAFDRRLIDIVIGLATALSFAYQFAVLLPHQGIDWQGHAFGLAGGVLGGWLFRERRPKPTTVDSGPTDPTIPGVPLTP